MARGIVPGFLGADFVYVFFYTTRTDPKKNINKALPPNQSWNNPEMCLCLPERGRCTGVERYRYFPQSGTKQRGRDPSKNGSCKSIALKSFPDEEALGLVPGHFRAMFPHFWPWVVFHSWAIFSHYGALGQVSLLYQPTVAAHLTHNTNTNDADLIAQSMRKHGHCVTIRLHNKQLIPGNFGYVMANSTATRSIMFFTTIT